MSHRFRLRRAAWLPVLGVTAALAAVPSAASASSSGATAPGFDPQNTNVPYLAWNGEQVRLEKCVPADGMTAFEFASTSPSASFTVEDWSGNGTPMPSVETQSEKMFYSDDFDDGAGGICAEGDLVSLNPGMARVELDVTGFTVPPGTFDGYYGPSQPFLAHQFLAGWMTLNTPSLTRMASSNFGSSAASSINDPTGAGTPDAGTNGAYLDVNVTGALPIYGSMANLFGGDQTLTLPNDWATLAKALATDDNTNNSTADDDWDTSGSPFNVSGHVPGACNGTLENAFAGPADTDSGAYQLPIENGDNCTGGGADGPFSLGNGGLSDSGTTIGPFDPVNASSTDLADGTLNKYDAPMPAARVDLSIAPNSGSKTDISGVGSLVAANKQVTYSRDFTGAATPGNLYAPFYDAYIPATARPTDDSSGIDGAFIANNFPGFLDIHGDNGLYHFWDTLSLSSQTATPTSCLNYSADDDPQGGVYDEANMFRSTPSGDNSVAVYTDQNGEAQVQYVPGEGYWFDNLTGVDHNADGGCDLQGITNNLLGTASITATAKYPYKAVDFPNPTSSSVTESVQSLFDKSLAYAPKGTSTDDQLSRIVVAHAQDIDGTPYADETVCFSVDSNAEGVTRFTGTLKGVYYGGSTPTTDPNGSSLGRECMNTDANGNAAIEVLDSNPNQVDVIADYVDEGLLRDITVDFSTPGSSKGTLPSGTGTMTPPPVGSPGTTAPTAAQVAKVSEDLAHLLSKKHRSAKLARLQMLRLLTPAHGRHHLLIRVRSAHRSARVALTLQVRRGRHSRLVHRTVRVRTNRTVKMVVSRSVTKVRRAHLAR